MIYENENTEISISGVNTEIGLSLYGDDMELYVDVLRSYVLNTPAVLDRIREVSEETLKDYAINVHGIKSISANIGAEETRKAALNLETMAKAGDFSGVLAQNYNFIKDTEKILANVKTWLEQF